MDMAFIRPLPDAKRDLFAVANVKEADPRDGPGPILILGPLLEEEDQALIDYDLIASFPRLELKGSEPGKANEQQSRYTLKWTPGWEEWALVGKSSLLKLLSFRA